MNETQPTATLNITSHDSVYNNDWVSSLQVSNSLILSGTFDSSVSIHTVDGDEVLKIKEHEDQVRKVLWVDTKNPSKGFLSASNDATVILWSYEQDFERANKEIIFCGHERGVQSIDVSPNFGYVITGGTDSKINVWSMNPESESDEPATKRRKGVVVEKPLRVLEGHKETITSASWMNSNDICSTSMDHTVKFWDAEACRLKTQIVEQKSFLGASWSSLANALLTCSADNFIRLFDPRSGSNSSKANFRNNSWVSAVCWCNYNDYFFVSAGYDHLVRVWDARKANEALHTLTGHDGEVLCADWSNEKYIVSGAADNLIYVYSNKQIC